MPPTKSLISIIRFAIGYAFLLPLIWLESTPVVAQKPELMLRTGHSARIKSACFSPDGQYLVSIDYNGTVKIWSVHLRKEIRTLQLEKIALTPAFSPDGKYLLFFGSRLAVYHFESMTRVKLRYDTITYRRAWYFRNEDEIHFAEKEPLLYNIQKPWFESPDVKRKSLKQVHVRALHYLTGDTLLNYKLTFADTTCIEVKVNTRFEEIYTLHLDSTIRIYDLKTGKQKRHFRLLDGLPDYLWIKKQSQTLVSYHINTGKMDLLNANNGKLQGSIPLPDTVEQALNQCTGDHGFRISEGNTDDDKYFYWHSTSELEQVFIWESGTNRYFSELCADYSFKKFAISGQGGLLAIPGTFEIQLFNLKEVNRETHTEAILGRHYDQVVNYSFSSDGRQIAFANDRNQVKVYALLDGSYHRKFSIPDRAISLCYSSDSRLLAVGSGNQILVFDIAKADTLFQIRAPIPSPYSYRLSFSPDDSFIVCTGNASRSWFAPKTSGYCLKFRVSDRRLLNALDSIHQVSALWAVNAGVFSRDGKHIALLRDSFVVLRNLRTGEDELSLPHDGNLYSLGYVSFSPDKRHIALSLRSEKHDGLQISVFDFQGNRVNTINHPGYLASICYSPDGKQLAVGGDDNNIHIYDPVSGKELAVLEGHNDRINTVWYSPDGRYLASGAQDITVKFWDPVSYKLLATIYALTGSDWACISPEGMFDGSEGALDLMHFAVNLESIALSQLKQRYYQPGLLGKVLGYDEEKIRLAPDFDHIALYPSKTLSIKNHTLKVRLENRGGGFGQTALFMDGMEIQENILNKQISPKKRFIDIAIDLNAYAAYLRPDAVNAIGIRTFNQEGYLSSSIDTIHYLQPSIGTRGGRTVSTVTKIPIAGNKPRLYAIVVGTSDYYGQALDLQYAAKDAEDFSKALRLGASRLFGDSSVSMHVISSQSNNPANRPGKSQIIAAFSQCTVSKPDDIVIVYLSGHGINLDGSDGDFYYLTEEARSSDPAAYSDPKVRNASTLSSQELTNLLNAIPARKKVLILDACASGRATETMLQNQRSVPASQTRALDRMKDRTGYYILAGSAADAVSYETSIYGQGLLTYALLKGMRGAALRKDEREEYIDVVKLLQYAVDEVPLLANGIGGIQQPLYRSPSAQQSYDIGQMTEREKGQVTIAEPKPIFTPAVFIDQDRKRDVHRIAEMVNAELMRSNSAGNRARFLYTEGMNYPGSYNISGLYRTIDNTIQLELVLYRNDKILGQEVKITGNPHDINNLARLIVEQAVNLIATSPTPD